MWAVLARCVLPLRRRASCSGTKSEDSACQGKVLRTSSGRCAPTEHGSLCKLQPLKVAVAETDTFHTEQWSCSSGANQRTLGLSVPYQWLGLEPSRKREKRTNQCPTTIIFHSSYPIFCLSYTCLHSGESHCTFWQCQLFQLLKSPCVAEEFTVSKNNSQAQFLLHSNEIYFSPSVTLVTSIVSDKWWVYYTKFRSMFKKTLA